MTTVEDWWPFERRMLPRAALVVERYDGTDGYQRIYRQRFVDAAVRSFDPIRFDSLKVALITDGRYFDPAREQYAVVDGQHREGMAEALGIATVPCDVYTQPMTYQQRALVFYKLNRVKQMISTADGARALCEGEDDDFLGLLYLLERHHFYLSGFRPAHVNGHRPLHSIRKLQDAFAANGNALELVLDVLQPWQQVIGRRHEAVVIGALMLWCRRDNIDTGRLRTVFAQHGPDTLLRAAGDLAARTGRQNPSPTHMANAIREVYNHNLRSRRVDEPF